MTDRVRGRRLLVGVVVGIVVLAAVILPLRLAFDSFTLSGNASGPMLGGSGAPIDVQLANGYDFAILVTDLRVTVRTVDAPHADAAHPCTAKDFVVGQIAGNPGIVVPAHASTSLGRMQYPTSTWPRLAMVSRSVNRNACQGASLTLGYTASRRLTLL